MTAKQLLGLFCRQYILIAPAAGKIDLETILPLMAKETLPKKSLFKCHYGTTTKKCWN